VASFQPNASPILFVLAGPNGAGKTTYFDQYLSPRIEPVEFVNPDRLILGELGRAALTRAESERGQALADARRDSLLDQRRTCVTESTFSHPSKLDLLRDAQERGYRVVVYHVGLASPEISVNRVAARVEEGGHPVPEDKIRGRFERNRSLIRHAVLHADAGVVLDNSTLQAPFRLLYSFASGLLAHADPNPPKWAQDLYGGSQA
jgi:predicted ABC-type ATPase